MTPRPSISKARRARIFAAGNGACWLCGGKIQAGEIWHVEHKQARGLGGSDDDSNLAPSHAACNASKGRAEWSIMAKADRQHKACVPFAERRETKHKIPQRKDAWPPAPRKIASRPLPKPESRR